MEPIRFFNSIDQNQVFPDNPAFAHMQKMQAQLEIILANPLSQPRETWLAFSKTVRKLGKMCALTSDCPALLKLTLERNLMQFLLHHNQLAVAQRTIVKLPDIGEDISSTLRKRLFEVWHKAFNSRKFREALDYVECGWPVYLVRNFILLLGMRENETFVTPSDFVMIVECLLRNPHIRSSPDHYRDLAETALARGHGDLAIRICSHLMAIYAPTFELIEHINAHYRAKGQSNFDALPQIVEMATALTRLSQPEP